MNEPRMGRRCRCGCKHVGFLSAVIACCCVTSARGIDILFTAPNTSVTLGFSYADLEFDNPLAGGETVAGCGVLEWRDAGFTCNASPDYEDWTPNLPCPACTGGVCSGFGIDGYVNEIWLRDASHSAATTTMVPGTTVSIHLHGDNNDGEVEILVDAVLVARLNMNTSPGSDRALVMVFGLTNTTHTIVVDDAGVLPTDDVAIMGAAVLDCIAPIPTVSEWGLVVMSLLLLTSGTLLYTRRRPIQTT